MMADLVYMDIMADPAISTKQRECERAYKEYVDEHINNVKEAWQNMQINKKCMEIIGKYIGSVVSDTFIQTMDNNISAHDMSKYSMEEWEPYRKNFNPVDDQEKENNLAEFEKAWDHHKKVNMHHWNWWAENHKEDKMPLHNVIEMCCDWIAMSKKFGGDAYNWYKKQTDIVLGNQQKSIVEDLLKAYYDFE